MSMFFDIYAIYNRSLKRIIAWSENKEQCKLFIKQRKLNKRIHEIIHSSINTKGLKKINKNHRDRFIYEYYGLIIYEGEEYYLDSYLDMEMSVVLDKVSGILKNNSMTNRDNRVDEHLYRMLEECRINISYGESFSNIPRNVSNMKTLSKELEELDREYKNKLD